MPHFPYPNRRLTRAARDNAAHLCQANRRVAHPWHIQNLSHGAKIANSARHDHCED
jgi:hypothetical protein